MPAVLSIKWSVQIKTMKQFLSEEGFDVEDIINAKNKDGRTALQWAIFGNWHRKPVQILKAAQGMEVNIPDEDGTTPLDWLR